MKLCVLALDYDGTIAINDRPDSSVLAAIAAARASGVKVLLVTGRILTELRRVAGDLRFVDAVVAENGAVVYFPDSGHRTVLAQPASPALIARLADLGIPFQAGECLIDADANSARAMLDVIHSLELPVVLLFNRTRVMALAQGVSKATGLTGVFGDHALAQELQRHERRYVATKNQSVLKDIVAAIRSRYDLAGEPIA